MPHTQAIGRVSGAVLSTSGEQLCSVVRFGRYQGLSTFSIDKGNALVCLSEIAVRGPFAAESRLCFIPCSGGTVIILEISTAWGRNRSQCFVQVTFVHARHVMYKYTPISVFMQQGHEKKQAVRSRGPGENRCYRLCVLGTSGPCVLPPRKSLSALATNQLCILENPRDEQSVTPVIGSSRNYTYCRRNAVADLHP